MPTEAVAGFLSYAHEDNKLDNGAILELARLIGEEYSLISGEPLELFVDHDSIAWGEEWRKRIDAALTETTFFIPIITPRYFTRPECRRELLEFAAKAKSLGVQELLLPILYVEPQEFSAEGMDEAIALVAKTQYVDWRTNRLIEFSSREYRTAVNVLARRLLEIARTVTQAQFDHELEADPEETGIGGVTDIMEEVTVLLPDWLDAVLGEKVNYMQLRTTIQHVLGQFDKAKARNAPSSVVLATQIRAVKELLPLMERGQKDAGVYLAKSIQLDPLVSTLSRLIGEHPDSYELIAPVRGAVDEAMDSINDYARVKEALKQPGARNVTGVLAEWRHLGRVFQKCYAAGLDWNRMADEGNDIVRRWDSELGRPADV